MKTLYLLRHAKSSWNHPGLRDHQRPLNGRGRAAAQKLGLHMTAMEWRPELVLSSTSERTRETWAELTAEWTTTPETIFTDEMYHASPGSMLLLLTSLPDTVESAMLLGHNPGMHSLAEMLAGDGPEHLLDAAARKYPTGTLAIIALEEDRWTHCRASAGILTDFVRPRDL